MPVSNNLRQQLHNEPKLVAQLQEAENLAKSLFGESSSGTLYTVDPFLSGLASDRFIRIEEFANQLIYSHNSQNENLELAPGDPNTTDNVQFNFYPNPEESMYLIAAIWLHDIGLVNGLPGMEDSEPNSIFWHCAREKHHERARDFIMDLWEKECGAWSKESKLTLGTLCLFHRRRLSLDSLEEKDSTGTIRMRELTAILRVADACEHRSHRAPGDLQHRLNAQLTQGVPDWKFAKLVTQIEIDQTTKNIIISSDIPKKKFEFGTAEIEFEPILNRFQESLRDELVQSQQILRLYSNLTIRDVHLNIRPAAGLGPIQVQRRVLDLWPYMLDMTPSATEVACILATIIQGYVRVNKPYKKDEIEALLHCATTLHPFNYLTEFLAQEVKRCLETDDDLVLYIDQFLQDRANGCKKVVRYASQHLLTDPQGDDNIAPTDVIIIYGYSHNVIRFLRVVGIDHKIIVVRCTRNNRFKNGEDKFESYRIEKALDDYGMLDNKREKDIAELDSEFRDLSRQKVRPVFLVGTRGIYCKKDETKVALSSLGNCNIARTVREYGGKVYVFAESGKFQPEWNPKNHEAMRIDILEENKHFDLLILPNSRAMAAPEGLGDEHEFDNQ